MADNILTTDRTLANLDIAAKEIGGVKFPRSMLVDASGADIGPATEATLAALLSAAQAIQSAANSLNSKTTAVNTGAIAGTVAVSNFPSGGTGLTDTELRASPLSVTGNFYQTTQPVSFTWAGLTDAQLRASPVGVSVSGTVPVSGTFWQATQPVSFTWAGLTDAQLRASAVPVSVSNFPATQAVSGTFWQATQPISAASLPLPAGAATESTLATIDADLGQPTTAAAAADGSGDYPVIGGIKRLALGMASALSNWSTLLGRIPAQGQAAMAASLPVAIASNQTALSVNAAPAAALLTPYSQAGVIAINTILLALDCSQYRSVSLQCVSMGTTGVVTPEWSNDNSAWVGATMFTVPGASVTTFNAAGLWVIPVAARYLRLRLSTATTGGTTSLSVHQFNDGIQPWLATQPVSGTVTATVGASISGGTISPLTVAGASAEASSAKTASGNSASALTNASGRNAHFIVNVSATSGTTPTLVVRVQIQDPVSSTWVDLPGAATASITGNGATLLSVNNLPRTYRLAWVIGGTTPSFTFSVGMLPVI